MEICGYGPVEVRARNKSSVSIEQEAGCPKAGLEALENVTVLTVSGIEPEFLGRPLCCLVNILAPV
jgi:hypothetical protein